MSVQILFVIGSLDLGGAERHLFQIAAGLKARGWSPEVLCLTKRGVLADELEARGVPVHIPTLFGRATRSFSSWTIRVTTTALATHLFFRRQRPLLIHYFLPQAYLFGGICALLTGRRISLMSRRSLNHYQRKRPPLAVVERWMHRTMQLVLGNSQAVLSDLRDEGVPESKLGLIHNGLDFTPFVALPAPAEARAALALPADALVMVTVANLIHYKGHADLLDALAGIRDRLPPVWRLLCVGRDDGILDELRARAARLEIGDHVEWLGSRRGVPQILAAADIGLLVSHEEGFSNAVLEGMAASLPMIVTDVGGNAEAVQDDTCGYVVPAKNPPALGAAIVRLLAAPDRQRLGAAARQRVQQEFTMDACIGAYDQMYRGLLGDAASPPPAIR